MLYLHSGVQKYNFCRLVNQYGPADDFTTRDTIAIVETALKVEVRASNLYSGLQS